MKCQTLVPSSEGNAKICRWLGRNTGWGWDNPVSRVTWRGLNGLLEVYDCNSLSGSRTFKRFMPRELDYRPLYLTSWTTNLYLLLTICDSTKLKWTSSEVQPKKKTNFIPKPEPDSQVQPKKKSKKCGWSISVGAWFRFWPISCCLKKFPCLSCPV